MRATTQLLLLDNINPYLVIDTFTADKPAGSVIGTLADVGVRTVFDTNGKLSISGGIATFASGGNTTSNPAIFYQPIPRILGLTILGTMTVAAGAGSIVLGYRASPGSGGGASDGVILGSTAIVSRHPAEGGTTTTTLGLLLVAGTSYRAALTLRASGSFMFIKGGVYTNWTLLWSSDAGITSPLYPLVGYNALPTGDMTADDVKVVITAPFIPVPFASDTFIRSNGVLGITDGQGEQERNGGYGIIWTGSTWSIISNTAINTPTLGSDDVVNGTYAIDNDWSKGTGWSITGGKASASTTTGNLANTSEPDSVVGVWYQSTLDVSTYSAGTLRVLIDGTSAFPVDITAVGSYLRTGRATNAGKITLKGQVSLSGTFDNVTRKALVLSTLFASVAASAPDVQISAYATLVAGTQAGVVLNLDDAISPLNFVIAYHDGVNMHLDKCVNGVYTSLINTAATYVAAAPIRVTKNGTTYILHYNSTLVGTAQTVSDVGIISNTKHGLFSTHSANSFSRFTIRPIGNNNEYSVLDTL